MSRRRPLGVASASVRDDERRRIVGVHRPDVAPELGGQKVSVCVHEGLLQALVHGQETDELFGKNVVLADVEPFATAQLVVFVAFRELAEIALGHKT